MTTGPGRASGHGAIGQIRTDPDAEPARHQSNEPSTTGGSAHGSSSPADGTPLPLRVPARPIATGSGTGTGTGSTSSLPARAPVAAPSPQPDALQPLSSHVSIAPDRPRPSASHSDADADADVETRVARIRDAIRSATRATRTHQAMPLPLGHIRMHAATGCGPSPGAAGTSRTDAEAAVPAVPRVHRPPQLPVTRTK